MAAGGWPTVGGRLADGWRTDIGRRGRPGNPKSPGPQNRPDQCRAWALTPSRLRVGLPAAAVELTHAKLPPPSVQLPVPLSMLSLSFAVATQESGVAHCSFEFAEVVQ